MRLRVLGTGSATPSLARASSSCLVSASAGDILIDAGPAVARRLLEFGCEPNDLDIILLTHFHPDHTIDLATLFFAFSYGEQKREKDLLLIGGRGIGLFFRRLARLYPWVVPVGWRLRIKPLPQGIIRRDETSLATAPMLHRAESIGVRIEEQGKSFVFSGDTDYSPDLVGLAAGADVLVVECTLPEQKMQGHLNLEAVRRVVEEAKPKLVILTHLSPQWEGFQGGLPAPLVLAEDGLSIDL